MESIGQRIKMLREKENISQGELGGRIGLTTSGVSSIEKGISKNPEQIEKIAKVFKVSKDWLRTGEGEAPKGLIFPIRQELAENPWKDEAYQRLKEENKKLWILIEKLTGASKLSESFLNALIKAGANAKVRSMFSPSGTQVRA
jgi:transcriptional regulator with XRE-family HTH domain